MDYLFMGNERIKGALDVKAATILGVKERDGKAHMATVVPKKGGSVEFVAKRVVAFINELGFSSCTVTIKTDQEASIIDLVNTIKRPRADVKTLTENSPVASSVIPKPVMAAPVMGLVPMSPVTEVTPVVVMPAFVRSANPSAVPMSTAGKGSAAALAKRTARMQRSICN